MANISDNAMDVLKKRYLREGETPEDMFRRVAHAIAQANGDRKLIDEDNDVLEEKFFNMMNDLLFLPNSPTMMFAGTDNQQLSACFVLPVEDSMESIFQAVKDAALIHKAAGGTGFSFSRLRPKGDTVGSTGGVSSGPVSFMHVFNSVTDAVKQGGKRRGANMGILRVDHPDILEFIDCKSEEGVLSNFNISVAITDKFMRAVEDGTDYELVNPKNNEVVRTLNAKDVFRKIAENAWKTGEPGIVFIDTANNKFPNLTQKYESTNPCSEIFLLPYESCNLGSIDVSKFVEDCDGEYIINFNRLGEIAVLATQFLNLVIEANEYPIQQIKDMSLKTRKIGLGIMGFADLLIKLGCPYNDIICLDIIDSIMEEITDAAKSESIGICVYSGIACDVEYRHDSLSPYSINSALTCIAPTGTISLIAGCSSGIEPLFALAYKRNIADTTFIESSPAVVEYLKRTGEYSEELMEQIAESGSVQNLDISDNTKKVLMTSHDISWDIHIAIQALFQQYIHNAISKTVNMQNEATVEDVMDAYIFAWKRRCKGITVYRDGSRQEQVLVKGTTDVEVLTQEDIEKDEEITKPVRINPQVKPRPDVVAGKTVKMKTGCGPIYITVNSDEDGPFEVFCNMGKAGGCASSQAEALARLASLALRGGIDVSHLIDNLKGIRCHNPSWGNGGQILSCADAIAKVLSEYEAIVPLRVEITGEFDSKDSVIKDMIDALKVPQNLLNQIGACPDCGGSNFQYGEGCQTCIDCSWTKCA